MNGADYKLNYHRQIRTSDGKILGWETIDPPRSLYTKDFDEFVAHCRQYNYHFNPENNLSYDSADALANYTDAAI